MPEPESHHIPHSLAESISAAEEAVARESEKDPDSLETAEAIGLVALLRSLEEAENYKSKSQRKDQS